MSLETTIEKHQLEARASLDRLNRAKLAALSGERSLELSAIQADYQQALDSVKDLESIKGITADQETLHAIEAQIKELRAQMSQLIKDIQRSIGDQSRNKERESLVESFREIRERYQTLVSERKTLMSSEAVAEVRQRRFTELAPDATPVSAPATVKLRVKPTRKLTVKPASSTKPAPSTSAKPTGMVIKKASVAPEVKPRRVVLAKPKVDLVKPRRVVLTKPKSTTASVPTPAPASTPSSTLTAFPVSDWMREITGSLPIRVATGFTQLYGGPVSDDMVDLFILSQYHHKLSKSSRAYPIMTSKAPQVFGDLIEEHNEFTFSSDQISQLTGPLNDKANRQKILKARQLYERSTS